MTKRTMKNKIGNIVNTDIDKGIKKKRGYKETCIKYTYDALCMFYNFYSVKAGICICYRQG